MQAAQNASQAVEAMQQQQQAMQQALTQHQQAMAAQQTSMTQQQQQQSAFVEQQQQHSQRVFEATAEALQAMRAHTQTLSAAQQAQATTAASSAAAGGTGKGEGRSFFSEASKVIRMPDPFGESDQEQDCRKWSEFVLGFKAWLFFADPAYEEDFKLVESSSESPTATTHPRLFEDAGKARSRQLYSILAGLLRHRPALILKGVSDRDGFTVWHQLVTVHAPRSKARGLAILNTLMQHPGFSKDKTLREQIAGLERLSQEYVRVSSKDVGDEIMLGTLLRVLPGHIRSQMQVQLSETSTYRELREKVLAYESVSTTWSSQRVSLELGVESSSHGGPAPMDIGQIKGKKGDKNNKGKPGKGKGDDQKGKYNHHTPKGGKQYYNNPSGKGQGNNKGKGYNNQPYGSRSEGKQGIGKGRGGSKGDRADPSVCLYCRKPGHWKRDCRQYARDRAAGVVREVSAADPGTDQGHSKDSKEQEHVNQLQFSSSSASTPAHPQPGAATTASNPPRVIRQLQHQSGVGQHLWDLTTLGDEVDDDINLYSSASVRMVTARAFEQTCPLAPMAVDHIVPGGPTPQVAHVESFDMTYSDSDDDWTFVDQVILDSGADCSVLPLAYRHVGESVQQSTAAHSGGYIDAQGAPLEIADVRTAVVDFGGGAFLKETFLIAPVTSPLVCLGRVLKAGWEIRREPGTKSGIALTNGEHSVPLGFRRNSLCVKGQFQLGKNGSSIEYKQGITLIPYVRAVTLSTPLAELCTNPSRTWTAIDAYGEIFAWCGASRRFLDTTFVPASDLKWRRTTLVQRASGEWELVEFCEAIEQMSDRTQLLPSPETCILVLTIAHNDMLSPGELGFTVSDYEPKTSATSEASPSQDVPASVIEADAEAPIAERFVPLQEQEVEVDGVRLNVESDLKALRSACELMGLSSRGRKVECFERLRKHIAEQQVIMQRDAQVAVQSELERHPRGVAKPPEPTQAQRAQHELVHYPYEAWCEHCVKHKGRQDAHRQHQAHDTSSASVVFFDFGFSKRREAKPGESSADIDVSTFLIAKDRQTKAVMAIPTPSKGHPYLSMMVTESLRFLAWLGQAEVTLQSDNEPAIQAVMSHLQKACSGIGIKAHVRAAPIEAHQSQGEVEEAWKQIRAQAGTLISQLESRGGAPEGSVIFDVHHPVYNWAVVHAAFLRNRYVVNNGMTAFECVTGSQYTGKLAAYGEAVLGYIKTSAKAGPRWVRGIWISKTILNDSHIVATSAGLFVTRSIRRLPNAWSLTEPGAIEIAPWEHGYANLGGKLVVSKRVEKPKAVAMPSIPEKTAAFVPGNIGDEAASDPPSPSEAGDIGSGRDDDAGMSRASSFSLPAGAPSSHMSTGSSSDSSGPPGSINRLEKCSICQVGESAYTHEDEILELDFGDTAADLDDYDFSLDQGDSLDDMNEQLMFPRERDEPNLSPEELQRLDDIADHVEILRLKKLEVLLPSSSLPSNSTPKYLDTRFVRSWRAKVHEGKNIWLRRSRFVAKEFAWMEDREDLFAPASSSVANRLLPALYVQLRETDRESDYVLYVMDIADAYLTVAQEVDTIVRLKIGSETFEFMLGRVLPGQRDGAQRWYKDVTTYLGDRLQTTACATHPSLLRMEHDGKFSGMQMHVDDFLGLSPRSFVRAHVEPVLREKYKLSLEILEPGTEVSFLKRRHILSSDGQLRLAPHPAHFSKLRDLLNLHARAYKKTPFFTGLNEVDTSEELSPAESTLFRSCVGILLYLSPDLIECQSSIRALASSMSKPTQVAMKGLRHLCLYVLSVEDQALQMKPAAQGCGLLGQVYPGEEGAVLECYSDSDWASNKTHRRSVSSTFIVFGGCLVHSSSRTQKLVSLSSGEAETYAATSGLCDSIFIRECLTFLTGRAHKIHLNLDATAARGILQRSGSGRVRHISTRILWAQQAVSSGVAAISKVKSEVNVADLGTKSLSCFVMKRLMYLIGVVTIDGTPVGSHEYEQYMSSQVMRMAVCSIRHSGYKAVPPHVLHRAITLAIMQVTGALGQPSSEDCDLLRGGGYGFIDVAIFSIMFLGSFFVFFIFAWWTLAIGTTWTSPSASTSAATPSTTSSSSSTSSTSPTSSRASTTRRTSSTSLPWWATFLLLALLLVPVRAQPHRDECSCFLEDHDIILIMFFVIVFFLGRWSSTSRASSTSTSSTSTSTSTSTSAAMASADDVKASMNASPRSTTTSTTPGVPLGGLAASSSEAPLIASTTLASVAPSATVPTQTPPIQDPTTYFPANLRYTPSRGRVYHRPGCNNIKNYHHEAYTREIHARLKLRPCKVCGPMSL